LVEAKYSPEAHYQQLIAAYREAQTNHARHGGSKQC
jgi:hypothetical protein